jgi:hypothetical protein
MATPTVPERTRRMGATWRRCHPALARQLAEVHATADEAWAHEVWGRLLIEMAAQVAQGRPLTGEQSDTVTRELQAAHKRRWERVS